MGRTALRAGPGEEGEEFAGTMITALEHLPRGLTIGDPRAEPKDGFLSTYLPTKAAKENDAHGAFAAGSPFTWTSYGFTVTSTICDVADHSRTLWGGAAQGIMGTHEWRFEPTPGGVPA